MARRRRKHEEHVNHERWLVSYADFITLLFAFFTTLYAISTVDQKKAGKLVYSMRTAFNLEFFTGLANAGPNFVNVFDQAAVVTGDKKTDETPATPTAGNGPGNGGPSKLQALSRKLSELSIDPALRGKMQIRMEARGLVVSLAEAGFFPSGSAALRPEATGALLALARTFDEPSYRITVEGHTDNVPVRNTKYGSNWELSTARASAVVALFIEKAGLPPKRLSASGYGEFKPVALNDGEEGRAKNRRVDVVISPEAADVVVDDRAPRAEHADGDRADADHADAATPGMATVPTESSAKP
jgi:chemotaxis protein MotB